MNSPLVVNKDGLEKDGLEVGPTTIRIEASRMGQLIGFDSYRGRDAVT